ncbi:uncharacterized protein B0H18DRAFT_986928 [Fomitopsis serialis]|uniref:uncharacterized protein n=1 Tax=Fomitopsis serialis TaxID=139415 RepID=UPI002007FA39|nr:uncharacterized protein B0H18DRAFT_986928 [Neoantrodia serialis]KAH9932194.1 hypothetical protein B0H18DRAFT_986928 [Neoantrodia serialis]
MSTRNTSGQPKRKAGSHNAPSSHISSFEMKRIPDASSTDQCTRSWMISSGICELTLLTLLSRHCR